LTDFTNRCSDAVIKDYMFAYSNYRRITITEISMHEWAKFM